MAKAAPAGAKELQILVPRKLDAQWNPERRRDFSPFASSRKEIRFLLELDAWIKLTPFIMKEVPLEQLSAAQFAELIGSDFKVQCDGEASVILKLKSVAPPRPEGDGVAESRYENFSLLFDGPVETPLAQRIHTFEHDRLGRFALFIVPVGNEGGHLQYQVVFNRLRPVE